MQADIMCSHYNHSYRYAVIIFCFYMPQFQDCDMMYKKSNELIQ